MVAGLVAAVRPWPIYLLLAPLLYAATYALPAPTSLAPPVVVPDHVAAAAEAVLPQPPRPFVSDGCSGLLSVAWRVAFRGVPPFEGCCVGHDFYYWRGGTATERREADAYLRGCVSSAGYQSLAWAMWAAVRPGGDPHLPRPYRWGYGYPYPHGYDPET